MNDRLALPAGEGLRLDHKSLRKVVGRTADFTDLAQTCVALANGVGGEVRIGIEDGESTPPPGQRIPVELIEFVPRRVRELTVNVTVAAEIRSVDEGTAYLAVAVARSPGAASTSDGRYFLRVGDRCVPLVGDDVLRLLDERPMVPWERQTTLAVACDARVAAKSDTLCLRLRASSRVKPFVREKADDELLEHYGLAEGGLLTNLGVLLLGSARDRARLGTAPVIQAVKYDERDVKVAKFSWDDHAHSPIELVDEVWAGIPDFRESYELPEGMFRSSVAAYDEAVIRELLVNALVHRPYTQQGDVFLNLYPDRLEIVNAGRLPVGVTPANILHASRRRNEGLARVFHDLELMEREGSGFDLLYERLLGSGRGAPVVTEGTDSVGVTVGRRILHPEVAKLVADADARHQLSQRERITLGVLGQSEGLSAVDLARALELPDATALRHWLGRLLDHGLIEQTGRTRATRYFVASGLLRRAGLDGRTTLTRIQPHRLRALLLEDLGRFPDSGRPDIHRRIGPEIHPKTITRLLNELMSEGLVQASGQRRWRRYRLPGPDGHQSGG